MPHYVRRVAVHLSFTGGVFDFPICADVSEAVQIETARKRVGESRALRRKGPNRLKFTATPLNCYT